jgi:hypothetical protein
VNNPEKKSLTTIGAIKHDNIKMDLKETEYEVMGWIKLAQDSNAL